jgi:hypothetical protein
MLTSTIPAAFFNVAAGFDTAFSAFYSSTAAIGTLAVYSGLDGSGVELATKSFGKNTPNGCAPATYCTWDAVPLTFAGTARSVGFSGGTGGKTAFDNMTFGCATPGGCASSNTPEPGSLALVGLALAGLGWTSRRARV